MDVSEECFRLRALAAVPKSPPTFSPLVGRRRVAGAPVVLAVPEGFEPSPEQSQLLIDLQDLLQKAATQLPEVWVSGAKKTPSSPAWFGGSSSSPQDDADIMQNVVLEAASDDEEDALALDRVAADEVASVMAAHEADKAAAREDVEHPEGVMAARPPLPNALRPAVYERLLPRATVAALRATEATGRNDPRATYQAVRWLLEDEAQQWERGARVAAKHILRRLEFAINARGVRDRSPAGRRSCRSRSRSSCRS